MAIAFRQGTARARFVGKVLHRGDNGPNQPRLPLCVDQKLYTNSKLTNCPYYEGLALAALALASSARRASGEGTVSP